MQRRRPLTTAVAVVAAAAVLLAACTGGGGLRWRDVRLSLPDGWVVAENEDTRFTVANARLGSDGVPGPGEVAAFFTVEPGASPQPWRDLIDQAGWVLEEDTGVTVGGVPATRLVYHMAGVDIPLREMVVVVPSRDLVILLQPVVQPGSTDGLALFDRHRDQFVELLESVRFGAPVARSR